MPNRILRDWTDSRKVEKLKWQEEVLLTRLIMKADDYGNFCGDPLLVKSLCFPRKDGLRVSDITAWLDSLQASGLIRFYQANGDTFLHILNFKQRLDRAKRKYPIEPENIDNDSVVTDNDSVAETKRSRNEVETETKSPAAGDRVDKKNVLENPFSENFLEYWIIWKNYKKTEHKFLFKSIESEQASLNELVNLSNGNEETAKKIIHQSLANGWKGLFKLKNDVDGNSKNGSKQSIDAYQEAHARRYANRN